MNALFRSLLGLCFLVLAGCLPVERFWWSPDGSKAVVVAGEEPKLYLVKPDGELKAPLTSVVIEDDFPIGVSWLPDGTGFVLHRLRTPATWEEARALLPADEVSRIERHALGIPHLLEAAAVMNEDGDILRLLHGGNTVQNAEFTSAAFFCARERQKSTVDAALLATPKGAEVLESVKAEKTPFRVHEICLIKVKNGEPDGEPQSIVRSIQPLVLPKVSPKFPVVAYWRAVDKDDELNLEVSTLDGKSSSYVADSSAATFDWTIDGRSVVLTTPVSGGDSLVQTIRRVTVLDSAGMVQKENRETSDLAVAIMPSLPRLCVLSDDRVLFASQPAKLPALSSGLDLEPRLFVISADGKSVNEVPTAPGDLPTNLSFFVASPDSKRVAVVESDTVAVAVVELATGKTEIVSPAHPRWGCRTMPAWKSATELTFAALDGAAGAPKWMLWEEGKGVRSISEKWPVTATKEWLSEKKDADKTTKDTP
jgi:hypothetical protein